VAEVFSAHVSPLELVVRGILRRPVGGVDIADIRAS